MITIQEIKRVIEDIESGAKIFGFSEYTMIYTPEDSTFKVIDDEGYYGGYEIYEDTEFIANCSVKVLNPKIILDILKSVIEGEGESNEDHYQVDLLEYLPEDIGRDLLGFFEETEGIIVDSIEFYTSDSGKSYEKAEEYKSIGKFTPLKDKIKNLNKYEAIGGDTHSIEVNGVVLLYEESQI